MADSRWLMMRISMQSEFTRWEMGDDYEDWLADRRAFRGEEDEDREEG